MFSNKIRILLSFLHILLFAVFLYNYNYELAILMIFGLLFQIYGFFRYNSIWLAFKYYNKQDFKTLKRLLNDVKFPNLLSKNYKGFYYMMYASIKLFHEKNYEETEKFLNLALQFGVRTNNNLAIIYIMFSQLSIQLKNYKNAKVYLEKAKETPHKDELNIGINNMEKEISDFESNK